MKALFYLGPGRAEIQEMAIPEIGPDEVLVKVKACGICATDVKVYRYGHPLIQPKSVLGHEITGCIAMMGPDVVGWRKGDRVVVAPYVPCGFCDDCRRGRFTLCQHLFENAVEPGGFSEYLRVSAPVVRQGMLPLPENVDFITGTLTEPLACCLHGLQAMEVGRGDSLLIIGDGPMGLLQAGVGRMLGAEPVIVAGLTPHRLAWASQVADIVVNVTEQNLEGVIKRVTTGAGVDKLIVSVGEARVIEQGLDLVRRGGMINVFAGLSGNARVSIDANRIHYDEIRILGTFGFAPDQFKRALEVIAQGGIKLEGFITRTVTLEQAVEAMEAAAHYEGIKTVVVMGER